MGWFGHSGIWKEKDDHLNFHHIDRRRPVHGRRGVLGAMGERMKSAVSTYGKFIADVIREDREHNESTIAKLCAALEQCKQEVEQFRRLSYGRGVFPSSKGMEMAEAILKEVRGDA